MKRPALLLCLLALPFCTTTASLSGSLSEIFPLTFNQSAVYVNSQAFELDYYLVNEGSENLVVELTVDLTGIDFQPGASIDLSGLVAPNQPRATVISQPAGGSTTVLPSVSGGTLSLSSGGQPGQMTTGSFSMAFDPTATVIGNGRTLSGSFAAVAGAAGFPVTDGGVPDAGPPDAGLDGG